MSHGIAALQDYTFTTKYAHYVESISRRETWEEATDRVFRMHYERYMPKLAGTPNGDKLEAFIWDASDAMLEMLAVGSQRTLQFGGPPVIQHNARSYNCTVSYADRPRFFAEAMYLLLCGCGVGFSVQKHHIAKLPEIQTPNGQLFQYVIPDTIEGWSDALGLLMASYFRVEFTTWDGKMYNPKLHGKVEFDYSRIRGEGSPLRGGFTDRYIGLAPGSKPLRRSLEKIRKLWDGLLVEGWRRVPKPIDVYDTVMIAADAVLSGGVRRSATICVFSPDDVEMITAKTGDWFEKHPYRKNSNNSALLLRGSTDFEVFKKIVESTKQCGEPGFIWADSTEFLPNPCQPASAPVLTKSGLRTFADIQAGDEIWSETGWTKVVKKWKTGVKPVYRYRTTSGVFIGTENHRVVSAGVKVQAGEAESIDVLVGPELCPSTSYVESAVCDGLLIGDGTYHAAGGGLFLCVGEGDRDDYLRDSQVAPNVDQMGYGGNELMWKLRGTSIRPDELPRTFDRRIPQRYLQADSDSARSFLRGLYSANGTVVRDRVVLKTSSPQLRDDVQLLLSSLGIQSYYTTNAAHDVEFENGSYTCRESYDVNITTDRDRFARLIGFIHLRKMAKLEQAIRNLKRVGRRRKTADIVSVEYVCDEEVFDITVDNEPHTYWTGGLNVSNCVEIGMWPVWVGEDGTHYSGWQFCNLSTINGAKVKTREQFFTACKAASIMGTLQAGYTSFPYLGEISEKITAREALLGVSITGMMDNPALFFDPEVQREGARIVLEMNAELAALIGINLCARGTCIKPSGNSSAALGSADGIHARHAEMFFRTVSANDKEAAWQYMKAINPLAVEKATYDRDAGDTVVRFPIQIEGPARFKKDVSALEQLQLVRLTQQNWVAAGRRQELCTQPWLMHNVSNTVHVHPDEWERVAEEIFAYQQDYCGITLLGASGELDYPQAPYVEIWDEVRIAKTYGAAAAFASGLIVDGLHAYTDLWHACDAVLGRAPEQLEKPEVDGLQILKDPTYYTDAFKRWALRVDWIRRAKKFAANYFKGDVKEMTYCLKRVHYLKLWHDINRTWVQPDFTKMVETASQVSYDVEPACTGDRCVTGIGA